ncbi:uncharacterized protein LOC113367090 [Ctenocephalides felis]|uniref:uncharacterized protein LOC113367090 n=1 Tax=Ctenocephalides felis TaxID=7515 RepID=UPI000E6E1164|nr:uncharacterized protein LOC113367090 [Ctenocephalides felis]
MILITCIRLSSSLANLYSTTQTASGGCGEWSLRFTGVPVLLHDAGICRSRSEPRVQLILAERGTCFTLWRDTVDHLSDYRDAGQAFHTMCLGSDHRVLVGLSFDSAAAAKETWARVERLVSDPENIRLNAGGRKKNKKNKKNSNTCGSRKQLQQLELPRRPASKSQISIPCQFQHVTSVTAADRDRYFTLQAMVGPPDGQTTR